jgi:hypothetical protein
MLSVISGFRVVIILSISLVAENLLGSINVGGEVQIKASLLGQTLITLELNEPGHVPGSG